MLGRKPRIEYRNLNLSREKITEDIIKYLCHCKTVNYQYIININNKTNEEKLKITKQDYRDIFKGWQI
ncbi:MAG: hypothetical protein PHE70_04965 [Tepidanaerobacteraceae bacterium]|nr:hypothetical protein [Tepidanaerobacteraceae bacterium]